MNGRVDQSRFWNPLWEQYPDSPSIALCRVPELEYAATLDVGCRTLDHCCGDGRFASLAWHGRTITAGCDVNGRSVEAAGRRGHYESVEVCDASQRLPFGDNAFDLVFDNSALEHIADLEAALAEVARVLRPGGTFAFNVLNHRYFEWWPLNGASLDLYRTIQPFFHALSLDQWRQRLASAGLKLVSVEGYFDRRASRRLAQIDYRYSSVYLAQRRSLSVTANRLLPALARAWWRHRLGSLVWRTPADAGAGYFIQAVRTDA